MSTEPRPRVYIAGAISANNVPQYFENYRKMVDAGYQVMLMGCSPYVPVTLNDVAVLDRYNQLDYEDWWETNVAWLRVSDVVLKISDSIGADREEDLANLLGIPVVRTLVELHELLRPTTEQSGSSS